MIENYQKTNEPRGGTVFVPPWRTDRPPGWLKTVSAFANTDGGVLIFGLAEAECFSGLKDIHKAARTVSRLIKEGITPDVDYMLTSEKKDGRELLVLKIEPGRSTPYYYQADGVLEAYVRVGDESVPAPTHVLNALLLRGTNHSYDALSSAYPFSDYAFAKVRERYRVWTGKSMEDKLFDSFGIRDAHGFLTNAGALLADDSPLRHSRLFCTRWNGLDKSGGVIDALDSAEYSGSLIILLNEGVAFVKRNTRMRWQKTAASRIEMPEYCDRSVFEGLVNALIHRDYLILGSEVHIDIYDDRLTITSPGGMPDGSLIQDRDLKDVASLRRNPVLADIFSRLGYMERQGSGFQKIIDAYHAAHNYREKYEPVFRSDVSSFQLTLFNLNYDVPVTKTGLQDQKTGLQDQKTGLQDQKTGLQDQKTGLQDQKTGLQDSQKQVFDIRQNRSSNFKKQAIDTVKTDHRCSKKQASKIQQKQVFDLQRNRSSETSETGLPLSEGTPLVSQKSDFTDKQLCISSALAFMRLNIPTQENIKKLYLVFSHEVAFTRADVMRIISLTATPASILLKKMKQLDLIEPAARRGSYRFVSFP